MTADERFMDMLLERVLGGVQAPSLDTLSTVLPAPSVPPLRPAPRLLTRWWAWSAAAILLIGLGLAVSSLQSTDPKSRPRGVRAPAASEVVTQNGVLYVKKGFALVDEDAPPVAFEDGVLQSVGGQVVIVAGDVPKGPALREMLSWLTGTAGVAANTAALLQDRETWFAGSGSAMALLGGGALLSGNTDMTWAGRTWHRGRADAPLRVALVASRDAVARLGHLSPAIKVADVDAGGKFVAALALVTTLERVDLGGCKAVDDAALKHLGRLERLKTLVLAHTRVSNRGIAWLTGCEQLERLDLRGLQGITAEGLTLLAETHDHRLAHLDVRRGARIDAAALKALGRCTALRSLAMSVANVLDAEAWHALDTLEHLRALTLDAGPEQVTGAILDQLRASLPNCEIRVARTGTER